MARPPSGDPTGHQGLAWAAVGGLQTLTAADLDKPARALPKLTQGALAKTVLSSILGGVAFYYLHVGRKERDAGKLFWAAAFCLLSLACLAL